MKNLVAYFSASGVTKEVAARLAQALDCDLYEIRPAVPYSLADLDWTNKKSRSSVEMNDPDCRPPLADKDAKISEYERIYVGFPIWWYREPSIIDSFLEAYDFSGKQVVPFATSGSSGLGKTAERLRQLCKAEVLEGKRFKNTISTSELKLWTDGL